MERDQAVRLTQNLAEEDGREQRFRPLHHGRFSARHQDRRHDSAVCGSAADVGAELADRSLDHERQAGERVRRDEGMQLRDRAARHRSVPRQRLRPAGARRRGASARSSRRFRRSRTSICRAQLKDVAMTKRGLCFVVGGTGSGKSTTLAAMIGHPQREHAAATSSRSRIRSSTCIRTAVASSRTARSASTPRTGTTRSRTRCVRRPTSS